MGGKGRILATLEKSLDEESIKILQFTEILGQSHHGTNLGQAEDDVCPPASLNFVQRLMWQSVRLQFW